MPIKRENYHLYPGGSPHSPEWKAIVRQTIERAGYVCEQCRVPHRVTVARGKGRDAGTYLMPTGELRDDKTGAFLGYGRLSRYDICRLVTICLTTAHLDHDPRNNDPSNLKSWCEMCHNGYDKPHRTKNAARSRAARKRQDDLNQSDLFGA